jgi:putative tryptophan/tyrosine transport system substrate-binding protein
MERRGSRLDRRQFVLGTAGLGLLAGCGRLPGQGQQATEAPRIAFLGTGSREGRAFLVDALLEGLGERGYVEGQNILIEYRYSEGRDEQLPALAAELVDLKVALIVVSGTPATIAARQATSTIPIVTGGLAASPVELGFVASLARPGGNITGMTLMTTQLGGKRLQLLTELVPGLARVAVFWNPPNPTYGPVLKELEAAADTLELELQRLEVRVPQDFQGAFEAATRQGAGAFYAPGDPLTTNGLSMIAELALKYRLPTMMEYREFPEAGGLLSYGPNLVDGYRRAAHHVDKILKGDKPGNLPMEQPMRFDFVLNLKTAQALGLTIPPSIGLQVTEVIQ